LGVLERVEAGDQCTEKHTFPVIALRNTIDIANETDTKNELSFTERELETINEAGIRAYNLNSTYYHQNPNLRAFPCL
jgi:hypothetical protein